MKRRTTTAQINEALTNHLLTVTKAEVYYKSSHKTNPIEAVKFLEDFQFLCEANVFMDCIGWYFEKDYKTNQYMAECCRLDGSAENIITIHMRSNDGVSDEDVRKALFFIEE